MVTRQSPTALPHATTTIVRDQAKISHDSQISQTFYKFYQFVHTCTLARAQATRPLDDQPSMGIHLRDP